MAANPEMMVPFLGGVIGGIYQASLKQPPWLVRVTICLLHIRSRTSWLDATDALLFSRL